MARQTARIFGNSGWALALAGCCDDRQWLGSGGSQWLDDRGSQWLDDRGSQWLDDRGSQWLDDWGNQGLDDWGSQGLDDRGSQWLDDRGSQWLDDWGSQWLDDWGSQGLDDRGSQGLDDWGSQGLDDWGSQGLDDRGSQGLDDRGSQLNVVVWRRRLGKRRLLPETDSIASGLISTELLAVVSSLEALTRVPAAPASRSFLTSRAAITSLRPARQEPDFTTFQQTTVAAGVPTARSGRLTRQQCAGKLSMAHGRDCSRAVRRREGGTSRRQFAPMIDSAVIGN